MTNYIMGLACFYHDSSVTLLKDGEIVSALQQERFSRKKQDHLFPKDAIERCLKDNNISLSDVSHFYYYENPEKKLNRIVNTSINFGIKGIYSFCKDIPNWLTDKLHVKNKISRSLSEIDIGKNNFPITYIDHHESHAASAFYPSPFKRAAVICIDGVGEWATTTAWLAKDNSISKLLEIRYPHSLGLIYSTFTAFCGFKVDSGEYKLMGLAPYGRPVYYDKIMSNLINVKDDGSFQLNMEYFNYAVGDSMYSRKFYDLFDGPERKTEDILTEREFNLASSIQKVIEDIVIKIAKHVKKVTGEDYLCLAGGVALNCVSNGNLIRNKIFKDIWIQPASGDSGGSLGAALTGWYKIQNNKRDSGVDKMQGGYLGTCYSNDEIRKFLYSVNAKYESVTPKELTFKTAEILASGSVVGWFQGKMEFGPRALGGRSILGDPRIEDMQTKMNLKIKNRESFRPFAPVVLVEDVNEWFNTENISPYMLVVDHISENQKLAVDDKDFTGLDKLKEKRSSIPAVTHVDYSARIQTVDGSYNAKYRELLEKFKSITGCSVLVNTSFNVRGEPIVETPENAYACFMRTDMDYLVIGDFILKKEDQPNWEDAVDWRQEFELD